ncbi:MAG: hypothetical protein NC489_38320 [Ruminococcus flavefaciens]|nr:hypothetical protein [Ruminococcus flavefaciens]
MAENIFSNPFVGCTARDMKYEEVRQYWCSPFSLYTLNESELFSCHTPIVIEGVRGTGKTMILKYLSYFVQKDFITDLPVEQKLKYFEERCIGVYFRYKDDFCNMCGKLDCSKQDKERIFRHYYELFIIRQILEILEDIYAEEDTTLMEEVLCDFLQIDVLPLNKIRPHITTLIRRMDETINSSNYDNQWRDRIMPFLGAGNMVTGLIEAITASVSGWKDMLFVILLDEYENLGTFQNLVNTLIKQVDDTVNLTYRLGMRPAGMENNSQTNVANENLQVDRDFLLRRLDFKNMKDYKKFALDISARRLESVPAYRENGLLDIGFILGKNEDFDEEAKIVAKGTKHFKLLRGHVPEMEMEDAIRELSCDKKLMEMYNIIRVARGEHYRKTGELCRQYQELRNSRKQNDMSAELHKYHLDYCNKYRVALLYILLTIYGERKSYYSVNTFLYLSSGSINDFISLCRNVFKHMNERIFEDLKEGISISRQIQTYASVDTAEDQRRKVSMSNKYGREMYTFIESMGGIFEEYHRDLQVRYPETNQFAFKDENRIRNDDELNKYLVELVNSGAIIRRPQRQLISVGKTRGNIYQLNRIYAPIYQYSYRTRGGYNQVIDDEDFRSMLEQTVNPKKYTMKNDDEDGQLNMFWNTGGDEDESTDL